MGKVKRINKKLASAVVLGLLMAIPFGANADEGTEQVDTNGGMYINGAEKNFTGSVEFTNSAVKDNPDKPQMWGQIAFAGNTDSKATVSAAGDILLNGTWNNAFYVSGGGTINVEADNFKTANEGYCDYQVIHAWNGEIDVTAKKDVDIKNVYTAIYAQRINNDTVTGNSVVNINAGGNIYLEGVSGIIASNHNDMGNDEHGVTVNLTGKNVTVKGTDGYAIISRSQNYDAGDGDKYSDAYAGNTSVNVKAEGDLVIESADGAIFAVNGKKPGAAGVTLQAGNINIAGDIEADKNALIGIGAAEGKEDTYTATIKGDVTSTNSSVNLALGQNGSLTGAISDDNVTEEGGVTDSTKGVALDMGNGSVWNVTGDKTSTVSTLKGTGTIALDVKEDATVNGGVKVADATGAKLTVAAQQTADDIQSSEKALQNMATATTGLSDGTVFKIDEGILKGGSTGILEADNKLGSITTDDSTSTMGNMKSLASVAILSWRQEDSTFSQRLGDLRETKDGQGIWARMSRGEFEYKNEFKNQYNYFQIGYDKAFGSWHYGAAISYNDGETSYAEGYGENDSTSLSLYGTWLGDRGQYTDIVLKEGRLNNKYTNHAAAGTTSADYDMWGTSISAEYGQKLDLQDGWFVTPQAQLTYMRIGSENYTAQVTVDGKTNSMQVRQDALDSFVGRIGLEAGKSFSDKGSFYAKASLLHEFAGDADTYLTLNNISNSYSQDLGDTWYEAGFGINYKLTDSSYLYADVVRTFGGDIDTPWQWNLGMRFSV